MFSKKEFAIVSNLRFISRTNFMLSYVEHEKSFITLGPGILELFSFVKISKMKLFNLGFNVNMTKLVLCRNKF